MSALPAWPPKTIATLVTVDTEGPHSIPVSAPVRADERTILLSLHRTRGTLARLRAQPQVALTILTADDTAFTARGTARVVAEPMSDAPDYAAVEITVTAVDDHRQAAFTVTGGVDRSWESDYERQALSHRVAALRLLASTRQACRAAAHPFTPTTSA